MITTTKLRRAAVGWVRYRPRSFEDGGARSLLIIKDLDQYPLIHTQLGKPIKERRVRIRICRNASNRTLQPTCRIGRLTTNRLSKSDSR